MKSKEVHLIQDVAKIIAQVDVYQSLAMLASENSYVRPIFNNNKTLEITEGRHGVIEKLWDMVDMFLMMFLLMKRIQLF